MNIRELVKLLRSFPGKSSVEIWMYFFDENEPRGHLDIVGVKHCQGCNTVVIVTLNGDGKMDSIRTWDVQKGKFFIIKKSGNTEPFTILKLTKTQFTFQDDYRAHGIATWTRVQ
jgi:hypothetical protein